MPKYQIVNLSPNIQVFDGQIVQPRTHRTLELPEPFTERHIERYKARQVFIQESTGDAENDKPLPAADPKLVDAYSRLATTEGAERDAILASLTSGQKTTTSAPKKAEG